MANLNPIVQELETRLTNAGREKLANGEPLNITYYVLSDDEVDYSLSSSAIESIPLFAPVRDETVGTRRRIIVGSETKPEIRTKDDVRNGDVFEPETVFGNEASDVDSKLGYIFASDDVSFFDVEEGDYPNATVPRYDYNNFVRGRSAAVSGTGQVLIAGVASGVSKIVNVS